MKNKKNTLIGLTVLVGIVMLGIGYAANSGTLTINGTAKATQNVEGFNVKFTNVVGQDTDAADGVTGEIDSTDADNHTAKVSANLSTVGDSGKTTFTVQNSSPKGIKAVFKECKVYTDSGKTTLYDNSGFFTVTCTHTATEIASAENSNTTTVEVSVTLNKVNTSETDATENFYIDLKYEPGQE